MLLLSCSMSFGRRRWTSKIFALQGNAKQSSLGSNLDRVELQDELLQSYITSSIMGHYECVCKYQMCKRNAGSPFIVEPFIKVCGLRAGVI